MDCHSKEHFERVHSLVSSTATKKRLERWQSKKKILERKKKVEEMMDEINSVENLNKWVPSKQLPVPTSQFSKQFPALNELSAELTGCSQGGPMNIAQSTEVEQPGDQEAASEGGLQPQKKRKSKSTRRSIKVKRQPKRVSLRAFLQGVAAENAAQHEEGHPIMSESQSFREADKHTDFRPINSAAETTSLESTSLPDLIISPLGQNNGQEGPLSNQHPLSLPNIHAGKHSVPMPTSFRPQKGDARKGVRRKRNGPHRSIPDCYSPIQSQELLSPDKREGFSTQKDTHLQGGAMSAAIAICQLVADPVQREFLRKQFKKTVDDGRSVKVHNKLRIEETQKVLGKLGVKLTKSNLYGLLTADQPQSHVEKVGFQDLLRKAETALYVNQTSENKLLTIADKGKSSKRRGKAVGSGPGAKYNPLQSQLLAHPSPLRLLPVAEDAPKDQDECNDWNSYWTDKVIDKPGWGSKALGGARKKHFQHQDSSLEKPKSNSVANLLHVVS